MLYSLGSKSNNNNNNNNSYNVEDKRMCQPSECAKFSWHSYKNHNNSTKLSQNNFIYSELSSSEVSITIGHVRELWPVALQLPQRRARVSVLG
jgi:hypothetical protein